MKLNKFWKIAVGLLTAWVTIYPFALFFIAFLPIFFGIFSGTSGAEPPPEFFFGIFAIFPILILSAFLQFGLTIFYISHVILNENGEDIIRILLAITNFIIPFVGLPAYYLIYILPKTPPRWALKEQYRNFPTSSSDPIEIEEN